MMKHLLHLVCCGLVAVAMAACSSGGATLQTSEISHEPGSPAEFAEALGVGYAAVKNIEQYAAANPQASTENPGRRDTVRIVTVEVHKSLMKEFPTYYDWWLQDGDFEQQREAKATSAMAAGAGAAGVARASGVATAGAGAALAEEAAGQYGKEPGINWFARTLDEEIDVRLAKLKAGAEAGTGSGAGTFEEKLAEYISLCTERREERLAAFIESKPQVLFTKFEVLRPSFFAYTEGQSDARTERNFFPGSELSMITMDGIWASERALMKDTAGVFRDPEVHFDGQHAVFAWKKSMFEDDFHLYEMDLRSHEVRQLTNGLGYADIEPTYLPDDNIMFNSTRCGTAVDCWTTEVSNLYVCDRDGRFMRRVGFDQVHTPNPAVLDDGRVVYTRWDYNDRGQVWTQPLFQMNPDGTQQSEYYGLNSWFPTTATHIRQIPGTRKIMATLTGHHSPQHGKLAIIDPEAGRDENEGVMMVAPYQRAEAVKVDSYGQYGDQFQYPYPLGETEFLISYSPLGYYVGRPIDFGIYWMDIYGNRELLASDPEISCNTPELVAPRKRPFVRASDVDYTKENGTYYVQNIYEGPGLEGIEPGTIKQLRVVEIEYRTAGIGSVSNSGPGGGAGNFCPPSVGNGAWDLKKIHGVVEVHEDGSALFEAPARTPLYFQALDEKGFVVQTMRSWSTLQPGEMQSCVGCHEHKNSVPVYNHPVSIAMNREVQQIEPIDGGVRTFSFIKEVQPILDRECVSCHDGVKHAMNLDGELKDYGENSRRKFSEAYVNLTHARKTNRSGNLFLQGTTDHPEVNWVSSMSAPTMIKPYSGGAATSNIIRRLENGHGGAQISQAEISRMALWLDLCIPFIGDYREANNWNAEETKLYDYHDRKRIEAAEEDAQSLQTYIKSLALAE